MDLQCPEGYKCCKDSCYTHKICKPIYSEDEPENPDDPTTPETTPAEPETENPDDPDHPEVSESTDVPETNGSPESTENPEIPHEEEPTTPAVEILTEAQVSNEVDPEGDVEVFYPMY